MPTEAVVALSLTAAEAAALRGAGVLTAPERAARLAA